MKTDNPFKSVLLIKSRNEIGLEIKKILSQMDTEKYTAQQFVDWLNELGLKTKKNHDFNLLNFKTIYFGSGLKLPKFKEIKNYVIPDDLLRKCVKMCLRKNIHEASIYYGVNRETLRTSFKLRYPYLYSKKDDFKFMIRILKTKEIGSVSVLCDGVNVLMPLSFRYIVEKYPITSNGNGYYRFSLGYCHRIITGAKKGDHVDHINGIKHDNRIENLRICTASQNAANRKCKGVFKEKRNLKKPYTARLLTETNKRICVRFETEEQAIEAYRKSHIQKYGEFSPYFND